jgi:ABC-type nitrate/sulfonate/bicarbonate transport system permease component
MIAIDITTALGSSIMAFILGMFIGVALGYIIWADRENQKRDTDESK